METVPENCFRIELTPLKNRYATTFRPDDPTGPGLIFVSAVPLLRHSFVALQIPPPQRPQSKSSSLTCPHPSSVAPAHFHAAGLDAPARGTRASLIKGSPFRLRIMSRSKAAIGTKIRFPETDGRICPS